MTDHHNYQRLTDRKSINRIFLFAKRFFAAKKRLLKAMQGAVRVYKGL